MDRVRTKKATCTQIAEETAAMVKAQNAKLKNMSDKLEMTLEIILDHFKELDERIEEIEDKLEEK